MTEQKQGTSLKPIDEVRINLSKMETQFQMALPKQIQPDKFVRVAITAVQNLPALLGCDRTSLYSACMKAAQDGLLPDGREGAIVPFKGQAVWMPMVGGILKKVRNSGELASIASEVIYEKDKFRYWVDGDGQHVEHEPLIFGERGAILGVYGIAKTKDGFTYVETMTLADVEKVRSVSRSRDSGPWRDWWNEMARKTVIRRLSKRLPMSTDLEQVIRRDDDLYDLNKAPEAPAQPTSKRLEAIVFGSDGAGAGDGGKEEEAEVLVEATLAEEDKLPFEKGNNK